jgi:hypothetical protein
VALSIITYIGCSISIVTMFIALTVFTCIRFVPFFNLCFIYFVVVHYFVLELFGPTYFYSFKHLNINGI